GTLQVTNGRLDLDVGKDGRLTAATASVGQASYKSSIGTLSAPDGASMKLTYGDNGRLSGLEGQVTKLSLAGKDGQLDLTGGSAKGVFNADGTLKQLQLHADQVDFTGAARNGSSTGVLLDG